MIDEQQLAFRVLEKFGPVQSSGRGAVNYRDKDEVLAVEANLDREVAAMMSEEEKGKVCARVQQDRKNSDVECRFRVSEQKAK